MSTVALQLKNFQGHSLTGSHVHCRNGYISETVQDRDVTTKQTIVVKIKNIDFGIKT